MLKLLGHCGVARNWKCENMNAKYTSKIKWRLFPKTVFTYGVEGSLSSNVPGHSTPAASMDFSQRELLHIQHNKRCSPVDFCCTHKMNVNVWRMLDSVAFLKKTTSLWVYIFEKMLLIFECSVQDGGLWQRILIMSHHAVLLLGRISPVFLEEIFKQKIHLCKRFSNLPSKSHG